MNKQELIALTNELLKEDNLANRKEDLQYLKREYKYILSKEEESFYEKEESDKFIALFNELAKKEPRLLLSPYDEKKTIIAEARKLLEQKDVLKANKELDRLNDDFRKAGRSSKKEDDDELFEEFRKVKDEFYAKKRDYFAELDKSNALKKEKKEDIIKRANEVLKITNIKEASEKLDLLKKEWKEVGYAGKGDEDLWKEFVKVLDAFQVKRKEHYNQMQKVFDERANKKEELIKTAKKILADSDFSSEEVKRIKDLRNEYRNIGFAGRDKDDDLYERFNEVIKKYFDEMKFYKY